MVKYTSTRKNTRSFSTKYNIVYILVEIFSVRSCCAIKCIENYMLTKDTVLNKPKYFTNI